MIIPVHVDLGSSSTRPLPPQLVQFGTDEVVLIELQGSLEVEGDAKGQYVGKLTVDSEKKKSTLLIGHHLLEGKLVNLPKPLAVMHRPSTSSDAGGDDPMDLGDEPSSETKQPPRWDIVAVVRRKMVFSKRPMPMVGKALTGDAIKP